MTPEDLSDLVDKVRTTISNYESYHVSYYPSSREEWGKDNSCVRFEVHGHSDQGEGSEWTEYWTVNSDGTIYADGETYKNYEEFISKWL